MSKSQLMKKINITKENKLGERASWEEYFMAHAIVISARSSCRNVRAGAVYVNKEKQIIGTGYNGAPSQIKSCYYNGCAKTNKGLIYEKSLNSGECIGVHAEMNALGHLVKTGSSNIELFTTIFPCHNCAKNSLPYGLDKITFKSIYSDKELESTLELFDKANIKINRLNLSPERFLDIALGLNLPIKRKFDVWSPEEIMRIKKQYEKI